MERNQEPNQSTKPKSKLFTPHNLALMSALIAMQIILARFLSIQVSDTLRISFESIPVILAGMWLGPIPGAIVAVVADFLGTARGFRLWCWGPWR